jgi:uncharacterized protein DUF4340
VSRRGLTLLSVLVLALALAVLVDQPRPALDAGLRDRVLEGFAPARIVRLTLRAPGRPELVLERAPVPDGAGGTTKGLALTAPGRFATDQAAVRDLLGTLEYLSWRRRFPADASRWSARGLDAPAVAIATWDDTGTAAALLVGRTETTLGRTWVSPGPGGPVYLVDAYAARALDRSLDDLRRHDPFALASDSVDRLEVATPRVRARLRGRPACVEIAGGCARADAAWVEGFRERLQALRLSRFLAEPPRGEPTLEIDAGGEKLASFGPCDAAGAADERAVTTPIGAGCVPAAALDDLAAAIREPSELVARSPLSMPIAAVRRVDLRPAGAAPVVFERKGGAWTGTRGDARQPLDEEAVRAWLGEVASYRAREVRPGAASPAATPETMVFSGEDGRKETLAMWSTVAGGGGAGATVLARRDDEPVLLVFHPALRRYLGTRSDDLVARDVLGFEPYALAEIELDGPGGAERAVRGDTVDQWSLVAPVALAADADTVARLRDVASHLRARKVVAAPPVPFPAAHTLTLTLDRPPGAPETAPRERLVLELAPAPASGPAGDCLARRRGGDTVYLLGGEACAALTAHLAARTVLGVDPDEIAAVSVGEQRFERHGSSWYGGDGKPLPPDRLAAVTSLASKLARLPVAGYGAPPEAAVPVIIETAGGQVALLAHGGELALAGRNVRYRIPAALCEPWPALCR